MKKISLVVITYNGGQDLQRCLESAKEVVDEIIALDSRSTDDSAALVRSFGGRVIEKEFSGYREQKVYAIGLAAHDLILSLDQDEWLSGELRQSILAAKADWKYDGYYCRRLNKFFGQWIHHGGWYPDRKLRLFDRRKIKMGGLDPHDAWQPVAGATTGRLHGNLLHLNKADLDDWNRTVVRYSTIAANSLAAAGKKGSLLRLLIKPPARFLNEYLFRRGFLDGLAGFFLAVTSAHYVFLREFKLLAIGRGGRDEKGWFLLESGSRKSEGGNALPRT